MSYDCTGDVVIEHLIDAGDNQEWGWECPDCGTWADGFQTREQAINDSMGCLIPTKSVRGENGLCVNGHDCTGPHVYLPW